MPNHVTNHIKASSEVLSFIKNEENRVDFNKVIPMPEELHKVSVNGAEDFVKFLNGDLPINPSKEDILQSLQLSSVVMEIENGGVSKWDNKRFENFIQMLKNYRSYGYTSWYEFGIGEWGTKWNAYETCDIEGGVEFQTAWNAPHQVIKKLTEIFPNEKIEHLWADEDIGSNLGHRIYQNGQVEDINIEDPVDFALTLHEQYRESYKKNPDTGKWKYKADEE